MAETLRDLVNGTIGQPYRSPPMQALGSLASLLERAGGYMDKAGVTMPQWSPVAPGASMTLRDMTIGDLPRVLENISYGMGPTSGGNYATGGIGTLGHVEKDAREFMNLLPLAALLKRAKIPNKKLSVPAS